jgi:four helix bundle protein
MITYKNLEVWKKARQLVKLIYDITELFPSDERFGLINQMQRCSVSIPSNIAEGCGRQHSKDSTHFLFIARGSLYELETQLYVSYDLNYITDEKLTEGLNKIEESKKLINGFIKYYKNHISTNNGPADGIQPS